MTTDHTPLSRAADKRPVQLRPRWGNGGPLRRALELAVATVGVLLLLPLMLLIAAAIKFDSPGPVIYRQPRVGLDGRVFQIFKFRTMTHSASQATFRQAERGDTRITRVGKLLRRINLDELPQLFNVLRGDMALVGPRPHPPALDQAFVDSIPGYMLRYSVTPGITGWAQVNGHRGETRTLEQMRTRVLHDLEYIENQSPLLDLKILVRTLVSWRAYENAF